MLFEYKDKEIQLVQQYGNVLPPNSPYTPSYIIADPFGETEFIIESALRGFHVKVERVYATTVQEAAAETGPRM